MLNVFFVTISGCICTVNFDDMPHLEIDSVERISMYLGQWDVSLDPI